MSFSFTILSYSTQYNKEADPFFPLKVLFVVSNSVSPPNKNSYSQKFMSKDWTLIIRLMTVFNLANPPNPK
jgi:hypothetical protein